MANCPYCDCYVSSGAKFCPSCGGRIGGEAPEQQLVPEAPSAWYAGAEKADVPPRPEEYYDPGPGVREVLARALDLLSSKPLRLWGMSLLYTLLTALSCLLAALPVISLPIIFVLYVGMESIYLEALYGTQPQSRQLFKGFSKGRFLRYACGMGWMGLWVFIWGLIPIVGPVFAVAKLYAYRFVPYIMLSDPEADAFEALERSKAMTKGFRLRMFLSELVVLLALVLAIVVLVLLSALSYLGFVFALLLVLLSVAAVAFLPLLLGLMRATFYDEIEKML